MKASFLALLILTVCSLELSFAYKISQLYSGATFFNGFDFFTAGDPTHGYVNYVNQSRATSQGYIGLKGNAVYIGSDHTNVVTGRGRDSVRLSSKVNWDSGLFILDSTHMPAGCGTWPAWWLVGPNWPNEGEIDIVEGVNNNAADATTLHTSTGCEMSEEDAQDFTGKWGLGADGKPATDCFIHAPHEYNNQGCGIVPNGTGTYGTSFNAAQGGVYVLEWTGDFIRAFFFPRSSIPPDIKSGNPDPTTWGKPYAFFQLGTHCPDVHFAKMTMVINLTFCGDWAGNVFGQMCPGLGGCNAYVKSNPTKFTEAYWMINSISVFQM